jgi:hypothetical protein
MRGDANDCEFLCGGTPDDEAFAALSEDEKHAAVFYDPVPPLPENLEYRRCHKCDGLWHPEPDLTECRCDYYEEYDNAL